MGEPSLREKTAKGLFWGGLSNTVQQLLGLLFGIMLGRLLSPADYGMIAMISIFSLIANELQNSGFRTALANIKHPTHQDYNSVFWFNISMGTALYTILFFCAPLIARFYKTPELVPLARYAFIGMIFSSLGTAQSAYLFKNIMAKQQAKACMTAVLVSSSVGVLMAWQGCSYWALATQTNLYVAITTLLYWHYSRWRPSLRIDFRPVRRMFRFSCKLLVSSILTDINNNIMNILLGRFYTAHDAGNYNQAYQWHSKCFYLIQGMVQQVAQPVLVGLEDEHGRQLHVLRKMMRFTAFLSFPVLFGLGMVSHEFIITTITQKWEASAGLLRLLCVSGAFVPLSVLLSNVIITKGKSTTYMWCNVLLGAGQTILMIMLYPYGIHVMVTASVTVTVLWFFVWHSLAARLIGYTLTMVLRDIVPFALAALGVMVATHVITAGIESPVLMLAARIVTAALLYYAVLRIAGARILAECTDFIMSKIRK